MLSNKMPQQTRLLAIVLLTWFLASCDSGSGTGAVPDSSPAPEDAYTLVWSDEFDVDGAPNVRNWHIEEGYGDNGWGNNERQLYTDNAENVRVENGHLVIAAHCSNATTNPSACNSAVRDGTITSARINSSNKLEVKYGKVQARIKVPPGKGTWPAFWMLGANFPEQSWPGSGEIDIVEIHQFYSDINTTHFALHWCDESGITTETCVYESGTNSLPGWTFDEQYKKFDDALSDDFHIFEADWDEDRIIGKIDGITYFTKTIDPATREEFLSKFFMILNVAVGGTLGGPPVDATTWPQEMLVDWVRVYQKNAPDSIDVVPDDRDAPFPFTRIVNSVEFGGDSVVSTIQRNVPEDDEDFDDITPPAVTPLTGNTIVEFDYQTANTFFSGAAFLFKQKDITHYEKIVFSIDTSAFPGFDDIGVEMNDNRFTGTGTPGNVSLPLSTYTPVSTSGNWKTYEIPLTDFVGVNLDNVASWGFWNPNDASDQLIAGKLYLNDIRLIDVPCSSNGTVNFSSDTIKGNSRSVQVSVSDSCLANKNETVVVVVDNGTEAIGVSVPVLASGLGIGEFTFGTTKDATGTLAVTEGTVLTASYIDANGVNQTDTASIVTPPLAVYSETRVDNVLPYNGIITDETVTDEASTAVAALEGSETLQADYSDPVDDEGGYAFDFTPAGGGLLLNGSFETPDATGGLVACGGNPGTGITNWECFNFPFIFNNNFVTEPSPVAHDGVQVLGAVGEDAIARQSVAVNPGDTVNASVYAMNWSTRPLTGLAIVQLNFLDAGNNVIEHQETIGSADGSQAYTLPGKAGTTTGDWTLMELSGVAPAGTVSAQIFLLHVVIGGDTASTVFYDNASITVESASQVVPDLSFFQTLKFGVNSTDVSASSLMDLEVRMVDADTTSSSVYLSDYSATEQGDWDIYEIPLADFTGLDLADIASLEFYNTTSDVTGDGTYPTHIAATLYYDDVHFTVDAPTSVSSGVLLNAAVQGAFFKTPTRSGLTNKDGRFWYQPGEMVDFYVGGETGILLGSVPGAAIITPVELTGGVDPVDQTATNMLVFLQSIDDDHVHTNGININSYTQTQAVGETLDFTSPTFAVEVATVVNNIGQITTVVAESVAMDNFYLTYVDLNGTDTFSWSFPAPYPVVPSNELGLYSETYFSPLYPEIKITEEVDTVTSCNTTTVDNAEAVYTAYEGTVSTRADFVSTPNVCNGFYYNFGAGSGGSIGTYSSDFESFDSGVPNSDVEDFKIGNIVNGGAAWFPGTFGAPGNYNNGYSAIVNEGGVEQGTQQLSIFNDYNPWSPFISGPGITIQAFVTRDVGNIGAGDNGVTYRFSFDAKLPSANGVQDDPSSQAEAFVKVLKSSDGSFNELANNTFDSDANLTTNWGSGYIDLTIDAGMVGELLQIGFNNTATDWAPSAVFYDNLDFSPLLVDLTDYVTLKFAIDSSQASSSLLDLEVKIEDKDGTTASVFLSDYTPTSTGIANWQEYAIPLSAFTGIDITNVKTFGFYNASSTITGDTMVLPSLLDGSIYFDDIHFTKVP